MYECHLPFCECRWSGGINQRWWGDLNTSCDNQSYLNVLHADVVGAQKHHFGDDTIAPFFTSLKMNDTAYSLVWM